MLKTRSKHDIIADILEILQEPRLKTHLMHHASLSSAQVKFYVELMEAMKVIRKAEGGKWMITKKGGELLRLYQEIESITLFKNLASVGGNELTQAEDRPQAAARIYNNVK